MNLGKIIALLGIMLFLITVTVSKLMSGKVVPPGTVVVILTPDGTSSIYKSGIYRAYGRDRAYFVDTRLKGFNEKMQILCEDKVNLMVDVKWLGSFKVTEKAIGIIKSKVPAQKKKSGDIEGYELSLDAFYQTAMHDIIRSNTREIISPYKTEAVQENRKVIQAELSKIIISRFEELGYPIETTDILISNLDFDPVITSMRQDIKKAELDDLKKAAIAKALISQASRDEEIAIEQGKATLVEAKIRAKYNKTISDSLTPELIKMRQWEVMEKLVTSPNKDTIIIPYQAMGMTENLLMRGTLKELNK